MDSWDKDIKTIVDPDEDEDSTPPADLLDEGESPGQGGQDEPASITKSERETTSIPGYTEDDASRPVDVDSSSSSEVDHSGRTIENRYILCRPIGAGAHGDVWLAHDRIVDEDVALKWMRFTHPSTRARVRREIATLRMLRLPGVVRLMDDGVADGRPFIVMELFIGRPFPGVEGIAQWPTIADTTLALLETLSQVHAAGVVHRDIKPDNVLVNSNGRPRILDFGISHLRDPNLGPFATKGIVGTPLYLAPEQILGREVDARTDLYAIGIMLYEALTGTAPHDAPDQETLHRLRLTTPARPIREVAPNVPANVAVVIDRLVALRAEERFASASDVIAGLRGESIPSIATSSWLQTISQAPGSVPESVLVKFFDGPDRLLHLREDAARILWQRTDGNLEYVAMELDRWVRLGLASRKGPIFAVDRVSLDWLAAGPSGTPEERRLRTLFTAGKISDASRETIVLAAQYAIAGKLSAATRVLADGLRLVREYGATAEEVAILTMLTKVALAEGTPRAFDQTLYELARAKASRPNVQQLRVLMQATLGAPGARSGQAREAVEKMGPLHDPELERARHRIRILSVAVQPSASLIAETLEEVEAWWESSGDSLAELTLFEGQARQLYHEGRFKEAASLYLRAAALETWATARIETILQSASASLEAFQHEDAAKTAETARRLAMQSRHPYWEGRAEWVLRSVQYRTCKTTGPDMELIGAVERVGAESLEALVCFNEAAAAMRVDEHDIARALAERAAATWRHMERRLACMIARALAIACGAPTDVTEVDELAKQAMSCPVPGLGIQALGLLGRVYPSKRSSWQHAIQSLVRDIPRDHWHERMDVLSVDEALVDATE